MDIIKREAQNRRAIAELENRAELVSRALSYSRSHTEQGEGFTLLQQINSELTDLKAENAAYEAQRLAAWERFCFGGAGGEL